MAQQGFGVMGRHDPAGECDIGKILAIGMGSRVRTFRAAG
jgi:hypothetical protein